MSNKPRILIVDDDRRMLRTLKDILNAKGYEAEVAYSGPEALAKVAEAHFDAVLTDIKMPEMDGVELYKAIKGVKPHIPVVLMTAFSTDIQVKKGLEQGAIAVLSKPLDINALLGFFSMLRKERSIVIVDDDPHFCMTLGDILRARGFAVTQVTDPHGVVEKIDADSPVVLLDMKLNDIDGLAVLRKIREYYPDLPVILATGYRDEMMDAIETALKIKAYACLYKPFQIEELLELLSEIHHKELARVLGHQS